MYARCTEIHWVPVTDTLGRRRMEMRWGPAAPATAITPLPARAIAGNRAA